MSYPQQQYGQPQYQQPVQQPQPYGQAPMYTQPMNGPQPTKKDKKPIIAMIFVLLAVIMIGVTLMMPWWGMSIDSAGTKGYYNFKLTGFEMSVGGLTVSGSYNEKILGTNSFKDTSPKTVGVFDTMMYLTIIVLIMAILGIIFVVLAMTGKIKPKIAAIILIISFIIALLTPVLFAVQLPAAIKDDSQGSTNSPEGFMGTKTNTTGNVTTTLNWGPQLGWILMLVGVVFLILGASTMFGAESRKTAPQQIVSPYPQQPMAPMQPEPYPQTPQQYGAPPPTDPYAQPQQPPTYGHPPGY